MRVAVAGRVAILAGLAVMVAGCSLFGGSGEEGESIKVFDAKPGQCLLPPAEVEAQISSLRVVPCSQPHTQEAYAVVPFKAKGAQAAAAGTGAYPGDAVLKTFAEGVCAQHYADYVGIDYLDSSYFFTYLLPSARGWDQGPDRNVLCIVTTTGEKLTASVKGAKR